MKCNCEQDCSGRWVRFCVREPGHSGPHTCKIRGWVTRDSSPRRGDHVWVDVR